MTDYSPSLLGTKHSALTLRVQTACFCCSLSHFKNTMQKLNFKKESHTFTLNLLSQQLTHFQGVRGLLEKSDPGLVHARYVVHTALYLQLQHLYTELNTRSFLCTTQVISLAIHEQKTMFQEVWKLSFSSLAPDACSLVLPPGIHIYTWAPSMYRS